MGAPITKKNVHISNFRCSGGVDCVPDEAANMAIRNHNGPKKIAVSGDTFAQLLNELSLRLMNLGTQFLSFPLVLVRGSMGRCDF